MKLFPKKQLNPHETFAVFTVISAVIILGVIFEIYRYVNLNSEIRSLHSSIATLKTQLASTTDELKGIIAKNSSSLTDALNQEKQSVGNIQQQLGTYQQQVGNVSNTVSTLQKLSKTDPQLLQKYSKVFFLNEYYAPARLVEIPVELRYSDAKILKIHDQVWPHLQSMLQDMTKENIPTYIFSAYRSFNEQSALKNDYKVTYGAGSANQFSADQGYSEHQLGTTVDFITTGLGGALNGFDRTKSYDWLNGNAYKYGFIISYPKDNKFYVFEPWHWRFVGVKLATDLYNQGKRFYDLDQRAIDEYLVNIFE